MIHVTELDVKTLEPAEIGIRSTMNRPGHSACSRETKSITRFGAPSKSLAPDLAQRAAIYVRMSTDHQQYSTANQRDAIRRFALDHGLEIVREYADEGRSGLDVRGRGALQALLNDVTGRRADFRTVLVYDVSRWGRFQDSDESAFYEHLCRRAGVRVEYCMEPFRNDDSPMSAVMKGLKRVMAGEYSRELSVKIAAGRQRTIALGFRAGGIAGFGYRRMLVDARGSPRGILEFGQHKYLQTDRVVLVPGPPEEQEWVRWIFRQVADRGRGPAEIARELNQRGVRPPGRCPWNSDRVLSLVTNENYIGTLVSNKSSNRLKGAKVIHPPDQWVRAPGVLPSLVDEDHFRRAQEAMAGWTTRISDARALELLAALMARHGRLSAKLINAADGMPGSAFYASRFGSLRAAYAKVGFKPNRDYRFARRYGWRRRLAATLRREVARKLGERGVTVGMESGQVLRVNGLRITVGLARCTRRRGTPRWLLRIKARRLPDWVIVARLNGEGTAIQDYCLAAGGASTILFGGLFRRRQDERHEARELGPILDILLARAGQTVAALTGGSDAAL